MVWVDMALVNLEVRNPNKYAWEYQETLSSASEGVAVLVPAGVDNITLSLIVTAGSGKVQYTVSPIANVKNNTANWVNWDAGTVSATATDAIYPITALKQVNVSGTTRLEVRAQ
jgi:hypothetical protein